MQKTFEVHYSFTCPYPECLKPNAHVMTVTANDAVDARELTIISAACGYCDKELPKSYPIATKVKEVKQ